MSAKAGTVDGTTTAGEKLVPGSCVVLFPDPLRPQRTDLRRATAADQNGRFGIASVAPGEFKLYAFEEMLSGLFTQDPDVLKPFEEKGVKVTVRESSCEQPELVVLKPEDAAR